MSRYPFQFRGLLRRVEVDYLGLTLVFNLELSSSDVNLFRRLWFSYLHLRTLEGETLTEMTKSGKSPREINEFLETYLSESIRAQERIASHVGHFLKSEKIQFTSNVSDASGEILTVAILRTHPAFYELLVALGERIALWAETVGEEVAKKPFWRRWFA